MPNPNKVKGSSLEREIAKDLSQLYNASFIRVIGSGSYIGGSNQHRTSYLSANQQTAHRGDLVPPDDWLNFNCECKAYKDLSFHQLFTSCKQLDAWIEQCLSVSRPTDVNIIIIKINRKGRFVAVQEYPNLDKTNALQYKDSWYIYDYSVFFMLNKSSFETACKAI